MIRVLVILIISCCGLKSQAQQMNWARLSEDTIYYAREYLPDRLMVSPSGPAQMWDFRSLKAPYAISRRIVMAGERNGTMYANLVNGRQSDAILQVTGKTIQMIQRIEENPICKGNRLTFTYSPEYKPFFHGVPGERFTYRGKLTAVFAWPRNMACSWNPPRLPDSCRITYNISEEITVDGEGTLYLPTEVITAFRQKVLLRKALQIEIRDGHAWRNVTSQVPGVKLITTLETLRFVSSVSGLQVAEIEIRDGFYPVSVEFKTHPLVTRVFAEEPSRPDIFAYPNPSYDVVRFQMCDLVFGRYKLTIFNILGVPVKMMDIEVDDLRETIVMDLGELERGTYLFRLQDRMGRTIRTKRIVLIQA